jgi:hypothetical protein
VVCLRETSSPQPQGKGPRKGKCREQQ